MICQDQVSGYSNNIYRGYEEFVEAQQEYHSFLVDEAMSIEVIDQPMQLA
jgi:viroplasmin and RNaseH domain-containing protein